MDRSATPPLSGSRGLQTPGQSSPGAMFAPPITPVILDSEAESDSESSSSQLVQRRKLGGGSTPMATTTTANAKAKTTQTTVLPLRSPPPDFKPPPCAEPPLNNGAEGGGMPHGQSLSNRVALAESPGRQNLPVSRGDAGERTTSAVRDSGDGCARSSSSSLSSSRATATASVQTNGVDVSRVDGEKGKLKRPKKTKSMAKSNANANVACVDKAISGRVTKAGAGKGQPSKSVVGEETTTTGNKVAADEVQDLQLREATKRRSLWTPTKDTSSLTAIDLTQSSPGTENTKFEGLISKYAFEADASREKSVASGSDAAPVMKKRRLQLVQTTNGSLAAESPNDDTTQSASTSTKARNPPKKKKPKAKPVTITSLTTAPYETDTTPTEPTLLEHVSPIQTGNPAPKKKARKPRATKSGKEAKSRSKKAKTPPPSFKVVPALDALKSLDDQTLVFGTCSQLERDASPELNTAQNRETATIKSSNSSGPSGSSSRLRANPRISKLTGSRSLWAAASRDSNDCLADIEVVDLQNPDDVPPSPNIDKVVDVDNHPGASEPVLSEERQSASEPTNSVVSHGTEQDTGQDSGPSSTEQSDPPPETTANTAPASSMPHYRGLSTSELASQIAAYGFKPIKNREGAISLLEKCWESRNKVSNPSNNNNSTSNPAAGERQSGTSKTSNAVTQAKRSSSSCETSTSSGASAKKPTKEKSSTKKTSKTSKTKFTSNGKPETDSLKPTFSNPPDLPQLLGSFGEIADSTDEEHTSPMPSGEISYEDIGHYYSQNEREHDSFTPSTETGAFDSASNNQDTTNPSKQRSWENHALEFSKVIAQAIKGQPRMKATNGIKQPTWYEKILMYDPVCVDDLTVWLNVDGLGRVGEDREVDPWTVRDWCESRGVCCTWKKVGWGRR